MQEMDYKYEIWIKWWEFTEIKDIKFKISNYGIIFVIFKNGNKFDWIWSLVWIKQEYEN